MRALHVFLVLLILSLLSSCAQTQLVSGIAGADIYVDGVLKGKGAVEIKRAGLPKKIEVMARYKGREIGKLNVKRKFDIVTLIAGLYTYGIGIPFTFRYPAMVIIPGTGLSEDGKSGEDVWDVKKSKWD